VRASRRLNGWLVVVVEVLGLNCVTVADFVASYIALHSRAEQGVEEKGPTLIWVWGVTGPQIL
jgi:hypothetical protein